jgi:hypothetical protein
MHPPRFGLAALAAALCLPFLGTAGTTRGDPALACLEAARLASQTTGVPYDVLVALTVVETGRGNRPWPWTVNLGGEGHWLDTAAAAEGLVDDALNAGRTNIDIGCFQLNHRWHGSAFASLADMFDPGQNALYAAEYLLRHYRDSGDWATAAAAYHSATPEHADRYRTRFEAAWAEADSPGAGPLPDTAEAPRANRFPLLVAGASGGINSLVPLTAGGPRLIGAP